MANCPICNKPDIGNYLTEHVVCPQCNSNLKGFMLFSLSERRNKSKLRNLYFGFSSLLLLLLIVLVFSFSRKNDVMKYSENSNYVVSDTIKYYEGVIEKIKQDQSQVLKNISTLNYIVKSGDNLSKIAQFFYNDWRKYKLIEQENNLSPNHILMPNDSLKISLN
jgi:hypothetical protein